MEPIRAERHTVTFFDGLQVDGYRMPGGEFRVGITSASLVLGYSDNWLQRVLGRETGRSIKSLRGLGFTEEIQKVVGETERGDRQAQTISLRDFNRLIAYAVFDGKRAALALQLALTEVALNDFFRDAFGETPLSIDEKRRMFYEAYAATIRPEDWRQMDREDILRLAIMGDGTRKNEIEEEFWNG
jgi:AraC-like DNA-binding protein